MDTTAIDRFGRIVIPKSVRDTLGLDPTTELTVYVEGENILLTPILDPERLVVRDGVTVFEGELLEDIGSMLEVVQHRRLKVHAGGAA
ncbi:MAG: AbrB/MazE/SpoVT family DNA-binding domain-containing protein [Armatimonadota bacterium]